jgi:hypothetical protein
VNSTTADASETTTMIAADLREDGMIGSWHRTVALQHPPSPR